MFSLIRQECWFLINFLEEHKLHEGIGIVNNSLSSFRFKGRLGCFLIHSALERNLNLIVGVHDIAF